MPQAKTSAGAYVFLGPELGKKEEAVGKLRKNLAEEAPPSKVEEFSYYAGEASASEIRDAILNGSLFAEKRIFFIKNADAFKKKDDTDPLVSALTSLPPLTLAVLISEEIHIAKALEDAVPHSNKQTFWELFENEKAEWVRSFFRNSGYRIDEDAVQTILEMVENNTAALRKECTQLCRFLESKKENSRVLDAALAEEWLSHTREESAFTLFSRLARGDLARSLESFHTLLGAKQSPTAVFAGLSWCFRKLRDYLSLTESGRASEAEFRKMGLVSPKARADYAEAVKYYNSTAVDACLALTAEYDILARQGGTGLESILMDLYLIKIAGTARL
jgi:DNA polymerase-3 subunit delta